MSELLPPPQLPTRGDVFITPSGDRIVVNRTARDLTWADVRVIQANGATWTKRQKLGDDGLFMFDCRRVGGAS